MGTKFLLMDSTLTIDLFPPFVFIKDNYDENWAYYEKIFQPSNLASKKGENWQYFDGFEDWRRDWFLCRTTSEF